MGTSSYDPSAYSARQTRKAVAGMSTFDYSDTTRATTPPDLWKAHPSLDPKGVEVRESRDSDVHPEAHAIAVFLDVTGSMGHVVHALHAKLPELYGLLMRKGYVEHPAIMFGGIGDATWDRVPLQVGQFESGNENDEWVENLFIEGGGGGGGNETYELGGYFLARHTAIDCHEKRGQRGLAFFIGDEKCYPKVDRRHVEKVIGDTLEADIPAADLWAEVQERWETYVIRPIGGAHGTDRSYTEDWQRYLGQNVLILEDPDAVCEVIALACGLALGTVDLDTAADDLREAGVDAKAIAAATKALVHVGSSSTPVATASGDLPDVPGGGGVERL